MSLTDEFINIRTIKAEDAAIPYAGTKAAENKAIAKIEFGLAKIFAIDMYTSTIPANNVASFNVNIIPEIDDKGQKKLTDYITSVCHSIFNTRVVRTDIEEKAQINRLKFNISSIRILDNVVPKILTDLYPVKNATLKLFYFPQTIANIVIHDPRLPEWTRSSYSVDNIIWKLSGYEHLQQILTCVAGSLLILPAWLHVDISHSTIDSKNRIFTADVVVQDKN